MHRRAWRLVTGAVLVGLVLACADGLAHHAQGFSAGRHGEDGQRRSAA